MTRCFRSRHFSRPVAYPGLLVLLATLIPNGILLADEAVPHPLLESCRVIDSDTDRLACYDELVRKGSWDAPCNTAPSGVRESPSPAERTAVTVTRVQVSETKVRYFYLDNGQVWKQTDRGSWNIGVPFQAELKPGQFGSFFLVTEDGKSARVKRVK